MAAKQKKSTPKKAPRNLGTLYIIQKRMWYFIPMFALLFGISVLQNSLMRQGTEWPLQGWATPNFVYNLDSKEKTATFEGKKVSVPNEVFLSLNKNPKTQVLGVTDGTERWIEVDLSDQKLIAWEGESIFLESPVSSGLDRTPTPTGEYRIWYKTKSQKMSGGSGASYYYLPNVPFIMFFENDFVSGYKGYSLHGAYWHNDFGNQRSHGCVNLPIPVAEQLYYWTNPIVPEGKKIVRATADNLGTRIVIHD